MANVCAPNNKDTAQDIPTYTWPFKPLNQQIKQLQNNSNAANNTIHIKLRIILGCLWKGRPAQLVIHYENGFTLLEAGTGSRTLWRYPFDRLKNSSDDGKRFLWLDFGAGEESDVVSVFIQFM